MNKLRKFFKLKAEVLIWQLVAAGILLVADTALIVIYIARL